MERKLDNFSELQILCGPLQLWSLDRTQAMRWDATLALGSGTALLRALRQQRRPWTGHWRDAR